MWLLTGPFDEKYGQDTSFQSVYILTSLSELSSFQAHVRIEITEDQQVLHARKKGPTISDCL